MIRPVTLLCAGVAAAAGLYLYQVKHQTQLLDRNIARTNQAIAAAQERSGVLRAEWTLMNDPERLAELAGKFLKLATVTPRQFTTVADLPNRLPAPRAMPARPEGGTDVPATETTEPGTEPMAEAPLPLPPPMPPSMPASTAPRIAAQPPRPAAAAAPAQAAPSAAAVAAAPSGAAPSAAAPPRPVAAPPPRPAPILATPQAAPPVTQVATPVVATGSSLGMARGIVAPPVPVGGN